MARSGTHSRPHFSPATPSPHSSHPRPAYRWPRFRTDPPRNQAVRPQMVSCTVFSAAPPTRLTSRITVVLAARRWRESVALGRGCPKKSKLSKPDPNHFATPTSGSLPSAKKGTGHRLGTDLVMLRGHGCNLSAAPPRDVARHEGWAASAQGVEQAAGCRRVLTLATAICHDCQALLWLRGMRQKATGAATAPPTGLE